MPIIEQEGKESPFFSNSSRRASISLGQTGLHQAAASSSGPKLSQRQQTPQQRHQHQQSRSSVPPPQLIARDSGDSTDTAHAPSPPTQQSSRDQYRNDSSAGPGTGLPDPSRPPVGQPQYTPDAPNFVDRPGPSQAGSSDTARAGPKFNSRIFSSANTHAASEQESEGTETGQKGSSPEGPSNRPERDFTQTGLAQPKPKQAGQGGMPGLARSATSSSHRGSTSTSNFEIDEHGERSHVPDISGIIRLGASGGPGSLGGTNFASNSGAGTGSRSRLSGHSGASSGQLASASNLAQQARQQAQNVRASNTRESVRNFIEEQSHTVNLSDPNAPTPSPAPAAAMESSSEPLLEPVEEQSEPVNPTVEARGDDEAKNDTSRANDYHDENQSSSQQQQHHPQQSQQGSHEWTNSSSGASLSGPESSEMATASGSASVVDDERSTSDTEEEPITTFRFEHSQTGDGHHVVTGREGILRKCEDEPITTPGAVQGFGVLIVLEEDYDGNLLVRQVSEVSHEPYLE